MTKKLGNCEQKAEKYQQTETCEQNNKNYQHKAMPNIHKNFIRNCQQTVNKQLKLINWKL